MAHKNEDPTESYWVDVAVSLDSPREIAGGGVVREYRVNLGVLCEAAELKAVVLYAIGDGNVIWSDTQWRRLDRGAIEDESIRARTDFRVQRGVWYRSGRILLAE